MKSGKLLVKKTIVNVLWFVCCVALAGAGSVRTVWNNLQSDYLTDSCVSKISRAVYGVYPKNSRSVRVATFNLLADGLGYYGGRAAGRCEGAVEIIKNMDADVVGFQEVSRWWFCNLKSGTEYSFIEPVRTELTGLMTVIAYSDEKLKLLESGSQPLNKGSNFKLRRAVWGVFRRVEDGKIFCVVNTHFNLSEDNNYAGLLQAEQINALGRGLYGKYNCPVFVVGDFNAKKRGAVSYCSSAVYDLLSLKMTDVRSVALGRSYGGGKSLYAACCDHIFAIGDISVELCAMLSQKELKMLSDHYALFADSCW